LRISIDNIAFPLIHTLFAPPPIKYLNHVFVVVEGLVYVKKMQKESGFPYETMIIIFKRKTKQIFIKSQVNEC